MSSRKSEILFEEAKKDIEIGNYNKAISAIYFSIRKELNDVLESMNLSVPRRDDKLANVLKHLGFNEESEYFMMLYELRKKADYSNELVNKEDIEEALKMYYKILSAIRTIKDSRM